MKIKTILLGLYNLNVYTLCSCSGVAKNVIMFLGDGMSIPTLAATRVYYGGEEMELSFEQLPYTALSKVDQIHVSITLRTNFTLTLI